MIPKIETHLRYLPQNMNTIPKIETLKILYVGPLDP